MKIGVLAVQGSFYEHMQTLNSLAKKNNYNIECVELRQKKDLEGIDGLIFPGGESTVQSQLLKKLDMFDAIKELIEQGTPVLATCAGLILLADKLENDNTRHLGTLPVTVKRNAYGRQLGSFEATADVSDIKDYPHVFIRAPYISQVSPNVKILSAIDGNIVGVEYNNQIGLAFHPEMTNDLRLHDYFIQKVEHNS